LTSLPPAGRRFAQRLARVLDHEPHPFAIYAAQAAEVLLDAIARSDGSRRSVTRELFRTRVHGGLLNDFAITATGDTTAGAVTVYRVHEGTPRLVDVIAPPARLIAGSG
jgi:ABC-type branched-subunit amino acid transport system substrate-binding protein